MLQELLESDFNKLPLLLHLTVYLLMVYHSTVIVSFASKETEELFYDLRPRGLPSDILRAARRKLLMINAAASLNDLKVPLGNRLEALLRRSKLR